MAQGIGVVENHATTQGFEYSKQWLLHHLTDKGMDKKFFRYLYIFRLKVSGVVRILMFILHFVYDWHF